MIEIQCQYLKDVLCGGALGLFVLAAVVKAMAGREHEPAAIRDALLPKLLSGEITVKQAERFVEVVA